jgi:hypothetical protein
MKTLKAVGFDHICVSQILTKVAPAFGGATRYK